MCLVGDDPGLGLSDCRYGQKGERQHHFKRYEGEGWLGGHGAVPEMGSGAWD